ncbi:MAG TPA: 50S ribosomal protein L21 [Methylocella sp.]|nr:50S ribosomal protein L21 [Methylocella sp.]
MFAVIKTGGKQYKAAVNDTITVMTLPGEAGETLTFDNVLMIAGDGEPAFGRAVGVSTSVSAEIVEQIRGPKVLSFKKRRRKNSKRKRGHRQGLTVVRITGISGAGA